MAEWAPITYWLDLDALDSIQATYVGPNGLVAIIDRAAFEGGRKPLRVTLIVGDLTGGSSS